MKAELDAVRSALAELIEAVSTGVDPKVTHTMASDLGKAVMKVAEEHAKVHVKQPKPVDEDEDVPPPPPPKPEPKAAHPTPHVTPTVHKKEK